MQSGCLRLRRSERRAQRLRSAESRCQVARSIHRKTFGSAPGGEAAPAQKNKMLLLFMAWHAAPAGAWGTRSLTVLSPGCHRCLGVRSSLTKLSARRTPTSKHQHSSSCVLFMCWTGQTPSLAFGRCGMLKEGTRDTGVKACTTIWALAAPEMPPATRCCCVCCILPQIIHHRASEEQDLLRALCSCAFTQTPRVWW